ncbi:hypothetical protein P7C71_g2334, partial [Lecanoromycetidae sp. Uapishka_2]
MSVQITTGAKSVLSLGVSLGDLAVALRHGRSIGNWLRAAALDEEMFESIMEKPEALLRRRGLITVVRMKKRWSQLDFIYQGNIVNSSRESKLPEGQDLSEFSWFMVTVVTALDVTLPSSTIKSLLVEVFTEVLQGDDEMREALRVQLPTNIQAWRSVGCVRGMSTATSTSIQRSQFKLVGERAIPQLNNAEQEEMGSLLVWLMADKGNELNIVSSIVYSIADWMRSAGVHLNAGGERCYESEPVVKYVKSHGPIDIFKDPTEMADSLHARKGVHTRAQQVSYPVGHPEAMIDATPMKRDVLNRMDMLWTMGSKAAEQMRLVPTMESKLPFGPESDIHYVLIHNDISRNKFSGMLSMLASHGFPVATQSILRALEELTKGLENKRLEWLHQHTAGEYLRRETGKPSRRPENMELWLQYQALVFGFYYKLMEPLVSLELVQKDVFFRGLWGFGSTTFLGMCAHFASTLQEEPQSVSRTHLLYMLATMYDGRQKAYSVVTASVGLVGILGSISVLALPLLSPSDNPKEIARFAVVDLPVIDLMSDSHELYSHQYSSIDFIHAAAAPLKIKPHGPHKTWSVHAKLGKIFGEGSNDVMMAARCDGRLVGWFGPLAADFSFLSSCYQNPRHTNQEAYEDDFVFNGFEIEDENWQKCQVQRPSQQDLVDQIGIIHSRDCAMLRYAATGFFANAGEELAIATDDVEAAVGRVEGQGAGIVIA